MTVLQTPSWPNGDNGKVLLHFTADCSVDALWEDFFGSYPELQAKLHKQRNDSNCAESPWVSDRSQLPVQQFVWPAPPAGADPGTPAEGKLRKVRFDAASSLASKAFNSEEIQRVLAHVPGSHYVVESEVYTNAMYGDQFCVMSRTIMVAQGQKQCQVHLVYAVDFKPSLSRLMKPMVAKGVDGGIRGSFATLKKLLQEQYKLTDLPDTAAPPAIPGGPVEAPAAPAPPLVAAPPAPPVPAAALAAPPLLGLADYIVYQELVASILRVSDPRMIAKALAMFLTLLFIHVMITALKPVTQACSAAAAAGGSGSSLAGLVCWPFVNVIDIPDSVSEVIGSMLMVAVANKLLVLGAEVVSAYLSSSSTTASATSSTPQSAAAAAADAAEVANGRAQDLQQPQAAAAATAQASPGKQAGPRSPGRGRRGKTHQSAGSPARSESNASSPGGGGGGGDGLNVITNLGNVMSGWGRNLLNGAAMDEGLKALMSGSWTRGNSDTDKAAAVEPSNARTEQGPGSASVDGGNSRVGAHNRTTSFTAVMDPSGLNIIEDYAQTDHLSQVLEESRGASPIAVSASTSATPTANTPAVERPGSPDSSAATAAERTGSSSSRGLPSPSGSPSSSRTLSPGKQMARPSSRLGLAAAAAKEAAVQPPLLTSQGTASEPAQNEASSTQDAPAKSGTPRTPNSAAVASEADAGSTSKAAGEPGSSSTSPERSRQTHRSTGKAVKFNNDQAQIDGSSIDKTAASFSVGSTPRNADKKADKPLDRRSASPLLYGAGSAEAPGSSSSNKPLSRRSSRGNVAVPPYEVLADGDVVSVAPGDEDKDEVVVEVFEHERVQPFRGWGHTWPGHFLPSDKVGHWGDRSGAPGGQLSMLFDRVAPKLPVGWTWKDEEWTVDMTGCDAEGCDSDGWSYGMDFSWLSWPPTPQSGKPGMKSFVRRRRWIRTRERLPPDSYAAALAAAAESADQAVLQEAQKALSVPLTEQTSGGSVGNVALSTRRSTAGDGWLMVGLGSGLGGLVGTDGTAAAAATAAVASATAMMNRFMKAVTDGQSPVGSLGAGQPAAAPVSASAPATLAVQAIGSGSVDALGARSIAASGASPSGTATDVGLASSKQVATGSVSAAAAPAAAAVASSHSSSEAGSSSSVDSDMEPPRPVVHQAAQDWVGQVSTLNAGPSATAAQSTPVTPAGGGNFASTRSGPSTQTQQGLEAQQQQQQQQSSSVPEAVAEVDQTQWTASAPREVDHSAVKPTAATAAAAAGSDDAGTSTSVLQDPAAAAGAASSPGAAVATVGTAEAVTQDEGQQACAAADPASTGTSEPAAGAVVPHLATSAQKPTAGEVQLESGSAESTASGWGTALPASEAAPERNASAAGDAEAGPGMGDLSEITAGLPPVLPVISLATDQEVSQTARGQSSADDWVWSAAGAGKGDNLTMAAGGNPAAPVSVAAAGAAPSAGTGVGVGSAGSSSSSSSIGPQPAPSDPEQGGIRLQSGPEAGSSAASEDVSPAAAVTPPSVGVSKAGFNPQPSPHILQPAPAATDPPAERSSSSSVHLHVNSGLSNVGVTVSRSPRDGVVPRGRGVNKRLNSSGLSRAVSSGRPKLGAVSLRQSEGGLRSAGGSGVLSPTAAAAAAAASEEWINRAATDASSSRLGETASTSGATAAAEGPPAAVKAEAGPVTVDDANDMGSGLSWGEGSSSEADSRSQGP